MRTFLILLFISFLFGCSDNITESVSNEVSAIVYNNTLEITNYFHQPIYYFVSERTRLAYINWAPISSKSNKIESFKNQQLDVTKLPGYQKGKQIVIIYWSDLYPEDDQMHSIVVDT